ncbi:Metallo-dependent phosphatase-like protein [Microdochium bolleyi]|uniref:Metallo-dependent phosphatase-like protein n=1 Tax=Microdochium bolleyi TaxID=196109 RepID=A0A136J6R6_9PEZI|nr:Metallo-dependent phosphatase-like protein [Microdochium bolleyi]
MENTPTKTRRTRFVCISDTHNSTVKLPRGDVLIHAGDLTNTGSINELSKQISWLSKQDFERKIVIAGNHDLTLDTDFYTQHGAYHHNTNPQSPEDCQKLLTENTEILYLNHSGTTVTLTSLRGPRTTFTVFGSPYTPKMSTTTGDWAFQYSRGDLDAGRRIWQDIPLDTDVLITHGPARTHRDEQYLRANGSGGGPAGCEALRQAMWRVRPRLAVCGHIHEGRGAERVTWDLDSTNVRFKEKTVESWVDPGQGNNKISLVDASRRSGRPLDNDGSSAVTGKHATSGPSVSSVADDAARPGIGVEGLARSPSSPRSDQPALTGRQGRAETCIINCAIMSGSYPHRGPRRLMKPIVVDIDLPVRE